LQIANLHFAIRNLQLLLNPARGLGDPESRSVSVNLGNLVFIAR